MQKKQISKNATGVDTSELARNNDLANLKSDIDKLFIDKLINASSSWTNLKSQVDKLRIKKLEIVVIDLSTLSNVLKTDVVKKAEYNELVKKVNNSNITDASDLAKRQTIAQNSMRLKKIFLMLIMINILLPKNLIHEHQVILQQD